MAPNQKRSHQHRPKGHWFLSCFGISVKTTTSNKKASKSGDRKRLFKLSMPKLKVIVITKKKVDAKTSALKASQSMIMVEEANKVTHLNDHAENTHEPSVPLKGSNDHHKLQSQMGQSNAIVCHKLDLAKKVKKSNHNKITKDSLTGLSIMVITIIIMSIWGRLCAILCMSAWLYCVPLLKMCKDARPNIISNIKMDMASILYYKKKMMLEGLLQRDCNIFNS